LFEKYANLNFVNVEVNVVVYAIKKYVIAILHHSVNSNDPTKHRFCPPGEHSWCRWQQDQATDTKTYKEDDCLPEISLEVLKPTFITLSESKLLERCIRETTQNPNECINSLVWVRCPKHKHHGAKVVRCAAASAICHFHKGAEIRKKIMERLSVSHGSHTSSSIDIRDRESVSKAYSQVTAKEKKHRQGLQLVCTRREKALRELEGASYEPGGF